MARRLSPSAGGGLHCPLLSSHGSGDQGVTVVVRSSSGGRGTCSLDGSAHSKDQSVKPQAAKGSSKLSAAGGSACAKASEGSERELIALWQRQTPMLFAWLLSSVVAAVFAPLLVPAQPMLLPALTAAALGLVGPIVHMFSDRLIASKALGLSDQISLVTACTLAAGCVDLLAMAMTVAWAWCISSQQGAAGVLVDMKPLLMFAFNCWQHGVVAVAVMQSTGAVVAAH